MAAKRWFRPRRTRRRWPLWLGLALLVLAGLAWRFWPADLALPDLGLPDLVDDPGRVRFVTFKPNQPEVWREIFARFARENPGFSVEPVIGPHSSTALHDLLAQKLKNASPEVDVFMLDVIWPPEFASAGWVLPLDDVLPAQVQADLLPGPRAANTWQGRLVGAPLYIDAGLLYYRRDLLAAHGFQPPATWEELASQAQAITQKAARDGRLLAGYSGQFKQYEGLVCNMLEFLYGGGGRVLEPGSLACGLRRPRALAAVGFVRDHIIGHIAPRGVLTYQEPESLALFLQGQAMFLRSWPYAWSIINDPARSRVAGQAGVAPLPRFAEGQSVSVLGGWQVGISAFTQRKPAATAWVRFITSPRIQKLLAIRAGWAPPLASLYRDPEVKAARPHLAVLLPVFEAARPRPASPLYPAISHALQRYFHRAIAEPGSDLPALAARACREVESAAALAASVRP